MSRVSGSIGIPGIARSAMIMANHPDSPIESGMRVLAPYKGNWANRPAGRVFQVEMGPVAPGTLGDQSIRLSDRGDTRIPVHVLLKSQHGGDNEEGS
jgi:hypothetical protein